MTYKENAVKGNRIYFLDNLRTFMIFLVVLLHSGLVYEKNGFSAFIWIVYDPATNDLASNLRIIMDIFIMSTIFLISGYLTPISLKSKNGWVFLKSKFKRLIIPWMIAVLTLMPLYKFIFLYSRNLPQQNWTTYFHWSNDVWSQNWLWFLPVLFLFDILYLLITRVKIKCPEINLKQAVGAILLVGFIYSVCMDMFNFQGWTKTILLDFQNERLLIYFIMFLLGGLCSKLKTFESKPKNMKLYIIIICTAWIPVIIYRFFYLNVLMKPGEFIYSRMVDTLLLWFNFHLSLLCLLYLMITTFRYYVDKQGKISKALNKNSYHVYIIHTIVMGGLAMILIHITLPSLLKFLLLTVTTFGISNLIIYFYRKVIQSKNVKKIVQ
jgi:fucose 4-O-acetylase-like acetyltransferase